MQRAKKTTGDEEAHKDRGAKIRDTSTKGGERRQGSKKARLIWYLRVHTRETRRKNKKKEWNKG